MKITDLTNYNMIDNFELICKNYTPTEKINWVSVDNNDDKRKALFLAKLYNRNKKRENYFLSLFLLANERKDNFTLLVRGNLNNWYSQKTFGKNLTLEEYKDCLYLLQSEIEINEHRLLNSKVKSIDVKISIDLLSIYKRSKSTNL
jgi:hypothetical protein